MKIVLPDTVEDEYNEYADGTRMSKPPGNLFHWWDTQSHLPGMRQMAFDLLSMPATSAETERVFSGTRLTISDQRARLDVPIIEILELQGRWMRAGP